MSSTSRIEDRMFRPLAFCAAGAAAAILAGCGGSGSGPANERASDPHARAAVASSSAVPEAVETVTPLTAADAILARREGFRCFASGDYAGAADHLEAVRAAGLTDPYARYLLGLARWKSGDPAKAEVALIEASRLDPTSVRTWTNLARVRLDRKDYLGALDSAGAALVLDPGCAAALHQRGRAEAALGRTDAAIETLREARQRDPGNPWIANTLGLVLLEHGRAGEAVPVLELAASKLATVAFVRNNLGVAYERCSRVDEAVAEYRASVAAGDSGGKAGASLARLQPVVERLAREKEGVACGTPVIAKGDGKSEH